jgi:hypothetical protein
LKAEDGPNRNDAYARLAQLRSGSSLTFAYAVEVKSSRQVRPEDLRALENFGEEDPQSRRYLLYRGKNGLYVPNLKGVSGS